jgi:hypothetical protein
MRRATVLVFGCVLIFAACGGDEDGAAETSAVPSTDGAGEPIVIRTRVAIAAASGAETIATGQVLEGSRIGDSAFCVGGAILDTHPDPAEEPDFLIDRLITCPDGTVELGLTPEVGAPGEPMDASQSGAWTIVGGTGAFEGLAGGGEMETMYGPDDDSPTHETLTGTVTP